MRVVGTIAVVGWGAVLVFWLVVLVVAPLGPPRPADWLVGLIPLAGMAVSYLAVMFWNRGPRLIGGLALAVSLIGLAWMWHGLLDVAALIGHQAPP